MAQLQIIQEDINFYSFANSTSELLLENFITGKLCNISWYNNLSSKDNPLHKLIESYTELITNSNLSSAEISLNLNLSELIECYQSSILSTILNESDYQQEVYKEQDLLDNGFMKSTFVIHEHDSKTAPLHWDLRFKTEFGKSAYSFVLLKMKLPEYDEKLLVKRQPMHPSVWVDLDHTEIQSGYGKGSVITIDRGTIYYKVHKEESFTFYLEGTTSFGAYHLIRINGNNYLILKAKKSIISSPEDREAEWKAYMENFLKFLNTKIRTVYSLDVDFQFDNNEKKTNAIKIPYITLNDAMELQDSIISKKHKMANIRNTNDVGRFLIIQNIANIIYEEAYNFINKDQRAKINSLVMDIEYFSPEFTESIEFIKKSYENPEQIERQIVKQKFILMFSDIYLGHKFYTKDGKAFDFEKELAKIL